MKILMITQKDAANASLCRIADSFVKRGHSVTIYAPFYTSNVLFMFDKSIECNPFEMLTEQAVAEADLIFAAVVSAVFFKQKGLLDVHKPIFTHSYLIDKQITWGGDFCFVPSHGTVESEYYDLSYTRCAIGEPKYDSVKPQDEKHKRFLFIDSGHYPFSEEGKRELARTLLSICRKFPDYELVIKPRFLPGDKVITHRNLLTLYDFIGKEAQGNIPDNMTMLQEQRELMDLIDECDTVICLYTTAFVGAYAVNKGLVVLENLPSDDVYDVRKKVFYRTRDNMKMSGALVDYHDVCRLLPEGVKPTEEYKKFLLEETENVADKIVEVTEDIYKQFYEKGRFPTIGRCSYKNYQEELREDPELDWEKIIEIRKRNMLLMNMLIHIDFHVDAHLDVQPIIDYVKEVDLSSVPFGTLVAQSFKKRSECIIENRELLLRDEIDAGVLLNAFYLLERYDEILGFPRRDISSFYMFQGFVLYEQVKNKREAKESLAEYFARSDNRQYIKEISDMSNNRFKAFDIMIKLCLECGDKEEAKGYLGKMKQFYKTNYLSEDFDEVLPEGIQKDHLRLIQKADNSFGGRK